MISVALNYREEFIRSIFVGMGGIFFLLESYEVATNGDIQIPYVLFLLPSLLVGISYFYLDGNYMSGYLKRNIIITSNSFDTKIEIKFGDIFKENGWKAISANDFFDNIVDNVIISSSSLHGMAISRYWKDDIVEWQTQIDDSLKGIRSKTTKRETGNTERYSIGTTAQAIKHNQKLLFVALGRTNEKNNEVSASTEDLICAVRGLLKKARTVCANEPINIPLMGSGLGRVGIKNAILVDLILAATIEETKLSKITSNISIILPEEKFLEINLGSIFRDWKQ